MEYGCRPSLWLRKQKYFLLFNKNLILATIDGMQMFGHYRYLVVTSYYATTTNAQRSDFPQLSFHLCFVADSKRQREGAVILRGYPDV